MAGGLRRNLVFGRGGALGGGGFGGGGGGDPFGAIGGFINSMGWNPELEQAKQLQALKIQAAQGELQAQRQQQETMAGFRQLGEDIIPEAGTQVPTEAEGPGADQVLGTFAGEPTQNDRLLRAMIQTGNPQLLAKAQAQFAPQEPQPQGHVETIGGETYIRNPDGKLVHVNVKEPKEPAYGQAIAERVAEMFGIPVSQATPEQLHAARRSITDEKNADSLKQFEQQKSIAIAMAQVGKDQEPMPPTYSYYDKTSGDKMTVPTKGEYKGNRQGIAVLTPKDADYYDLLSTATPNLDLMDKVLPKILKKSGGGPNLFTALGIKMERLGGSTPELAAFDMARNFLITNMTRVETGGVRPPQTLIKIVTNQLPLDRNTLQAAQTEIGIMRQEVKNRQGAMLGNRPQALPAPASVGGGLKFKVTPIQ